MINNSNNIDINNTDNISIDSNHEIQSYHRKNESLEIDSIHPIDDLEKNIDNNYDNDDNDFTKPLSRIESIKSVRDEIPDKFSGWGLTSVIGCAFFNFNTWGANSAYSLYLQAYLRDNIFDGANKYSYAIIGGLTFSSGFIMSPFINYLVGIIGVKSVILIGIIINFVAYMLASYSTKLWEIYCTQGVLAGIGMGLICVANIGIVPQWFKGGPGGKRNLAMGFQAAGSGIGGIVYNIGLQPVLENKSFRWSLRAQAIMCIGLNLISLLLVKTRNDKIKPVYKVYDKLIWKNFGCLCLLIWIMFTLFGYVVLLYNLGDFTRSLGYNQHQASVVSTMVSVGVIYGRPLCGRIGDIIGPVNITICASWLVALFSWAMWIPCRNYATAIVFAMFSGSIMGTIWLTLSTITASIVGLRKFGVAMSLSWISVASFGFASPIIGIALKKDGPQNPTQYQPASIFVGLCYFMAGITLVIVRSWLISRNKKANPEKDTEDDVLEINVTFKEVISNIFEYGKV
ncbi:Mch2 protein [Pichia kluyveri]|uniref:Mch2 protein n=1 Tax=Pichia kluyveri TaxID=36015 RepID=A0AAV5QWN8_PICKL|nr:Mch2 protein [Pichia kluyveri]